MSIVDRARPLDSPQSHTVIDTHHLSAARIAGIYLIAGLLWIGLSDLTLAGMASLTSTAFWVSTAKGATFVVLSAALVYWLCRVEHRKTKRTIALLQAVVEGTSDAVFVKDRDGQYLLVNSSAARFLGKTVQEVLGRDDRALFPSAEAESLMASDKRIMEGGQAVTLDERLTSAGITRTYQATKAPFFDAAGNTAGLIGISRDVTDRAYVDATLRETDARLREAQRIARLGSWSWEPQTDRVWWSDALFNLFGLEPQEIQPSFNAFLGLLHPDDRSTAITRVQAMRDGADTFANDLRIVRADGTQIWIHSRARATRDENGILIRVEGTDQDITSQRTAEDRLREQEMLVREAAELAKVGGWGFDPVTLKADWTPEVARMYGLPPDAVPALEDSLGFFNEEQRPALAAALSAAIQDGIPHDMELQLTGVDGVERWVRTICRPIVEGGRVIRVRGSLQDITDRKRVEAELRAGELRYRMLFDCNPHPMWVYDIESLRFLEVNDAAIATYGYTRDEFLGMTIRDIRPLEEVPRLEASVAKMVRGLNHSTEWKHRRKNGQLFDVDISTHELPEQYGNARLVLALNVTDRKRAEAGLQASERRLRLALEAAGAIAFDWDVPNDTVSRYFSKEPALPATVERVGTLNEVRSKIHPHDLSDFDSRLNACLGSGSEYRNAYRVVRPDGSVANLEEFGFLDRAPDGSPLRLTGMSIDVTERVAAMELLRISEERLRVALNGARGGVWDCNLETGDAWWSPEMYSLMGASKNVDTRESGVMELIYEEDRQRVKDAIANAIARRVDYRCEFRVQGGARWISSDARFSFDAMGNPTRLIGISWDVTDRITAIESLRLSESRYRQLVDILRSVMDSVGDAILTVDATGVVTSTNRSTERLFGYAEQDLIGGKLQVLIPKAQCEQFDARDAIALANAPQKIGVSREVEGMRKDGTSFPAELTITEFLRDGVREFTVVLRDITARRQLEEQFRQAQKMEAVGRLAGGVAHDFNNLLTVINGYCELMLEGLDLDHSTRGPLIAIHEAGDRAARLTQQLLALSRKSMVEPKLVDLNVLVVESARLFERLIGEDITLAVRTDAMPVRVVLDPGQLEQVLMNLVVNARDAMPRGGRLTIETKNVELANGSVISHPDLPFGKYALLKVTDTGLGIANEIQDKIFEPFFTTKGLGKGTGLGLAVVHGVVQQSGGAIKVESSLGIGTAFSIMFPSVTESVFSAPQVESALDLRGDETVLLAEDEEAVRSLVQLALESQGYKVLVATSGLEAISVLRTTTFKIDLLVTDVIMPEVSGPELASLAKEICPGLRVLFMSGYTDDALDRHGLRGTADQFIQKPFTPLVILRSIREVLDRRESSVGSESY